MNYCVNYYWVLTLIRYLEKQKCSSNRLSDIVNVIGRDNNSLTVAQASVALDIAESMVEDSTAVLRSALSSRITDYRYIGMLLSCAPDPLSLLRDKTFMQRYVVQAVDIEYKALPCGACIVYSLPEDSCRHIYTILGQFILYANQCIQQNSGEVNLLRLTVNEEQVRFIERGKPIFEKIQGIKSKDRKLQCKVVFEINSPCNTYVGIKKSIGSKSDIFENLYSMLVQDKSYLLRASLPDQVIQLAYANIQNPEFGYQWTAKELGMCERKLQKNLKAHNTSYRELVDEVRKNLAEKYLVKQDCSVTETAFMLGYTATSNFIRAYRRWWGCSPMSSEKLLMSSYDSVASHVG